MEYYPDICLNDTMYAPGNYHCHCSECKEFFIGHKRALNCKSCAEKWVARYNSFTQEERANFSKKQAEVVEAYFKDDYPRLKL